MERPWLRTAKLILHPPVATEGLCRYAVTTFTVTPSGIQRGAILLDGTLEGVPVMPTTQELLEAFDAALRQNLISPR